jgi:hypothetical protein
LFLRRRPDTHCPRLQLPVDGRHHGGGAVALFQQQATQPPQVRNGIGGRIVDQIRDLAQPETQPPIGEHLPQPLHVARAVGPMPGRGPRGRPQQADLVVVVQGANGHTGKSGHPSHRQVLRHATDYLP